MKHLNTYEAETSAYEPPKFVKKPYPGDTGFEVARNHYHRFLWTNPKLGKKGKIDKGEPAKNTNEAAFDDYVSTHDWDSQNPAEISGMGLSQDFPSEGPVGYTGSKIGLKHLPSKYYEDPDKRKSRLKKEKLKKIKSFSDFNQK